MKKITSIFLTLAVIIMLGSCSAGDPTSKVKSDAAALAQKEIINTFGITEDNRKIVAYDGEDEYMKYIVINYSDGEKTDEELHYFFFMDSDFDRFAEKFGKDDPVTIEKEKRYVKLAGSEANTGSYETDKQLIGETYTIK